MRVISGTEVDDLLDMPAMVEAMHRAFTEPVVEPVRHHHEMEKGAGTPASTLLLMPAWTAPENAQGSALQGSGEAGPRPTAYAGVKIVTVSPDNHRHGLPSILGSYFLSSGTTGEPLALIDGRALTLWRTAATSALAARILSRPDSRRHLVLGAGALAPYLAMAMRAVRPIEETLIWNRTPERAEAVARGLVETGIAARDVADLSASIGSADIVSAATMSRTALILGGWLAPGTHLDLVGAFSPAMRETDDAAVARSRLFVDTRAGALKEGGDLVQAIASGAISQADIVAELSELASGTGMGRGSPEEITLFKSVGAAREDLAAAILVYERALGAS